MVSLHFDGRYDTRLASDFYEALEEVEWAFENVAYPSNGCYYSPDGYRRVYFFEEMGPGTPGPIVLRWIRVEVSDLGVDVDEVPGWDVPPHWLPESDACLEGELDGTLVNGGVVQEIPTASGVGLLALVGLLAVAAWRRLPG